MKKMTYVLFSGALLFALTTTTVNAQNSFASNPNFAKFNYSTPAPEKEVENVKTLNSNAMADFEKKNKDASEVRWTSSNNLFSVHYKKESVQMRSTYNEKGHWEYTLGYLKGTQIPKHITRVVRSNGYTMNVNQVIEVKRRKGTFHFVQMDDENSLVTLIVINGEVQVYEHLKKG